MNEEPPKDLDWVQLRKEMLLVSPASETIREKFGRKISENPFVPIGCLLTTAALSYGLWCFRTGKSKMSQQMMRLRIVAQGLTISAVLVGALMVNTTKPSDTSTK